MPLFLEINANGIFTFQVMYYAVLVFQLVFVALQSTYLKRREYFYYSLYIVGLGIYCLAINESLLQTEIFFTRYPVLQPFFDKPMVIICVFLYYRFARYFLDIPRNHLLFNEKVKQIEYFLLLSIVIEVLLLFFTGKTLFEEMSFVFISISILVYTGYIIYQYLHLKNSNLNYFAMAGASLIVLGSLGSLLIFNLINFQVIEQGFVPSLPQQIASLFELLIFSTGLGYKTFLMENEKVIAERALVYELRENEALQNNMQQLRNKIAGDLHDDIGATLGSINVYADVSERMIDEGNKTDAKNYLNRIVELSKESLNDMRNMIWALNPEHDSLGDLIQRMKDYGAPLLSAKEILFFVEMDDLLGSKKNSVLAKRNLFLIFKEAIHNIIKYAHCKKVRIKISLTEDNLLFEIADDGLGFDVDIKTEGNGLNNLHRRAKELNGELAIISELNEGTAIRLKLQMPES